MVGVVPPPFSILDLFGRLIKKVYPWLVRAESIRLRIPMLRRENLGLPFTLNLIIFNPFMLVNAIHHLMYIPSKICGEGFPYV